MYQYLIHRKQGDKEKGIANLQVAKPQQTPEKQKNIDLLIERLRAE